MIDNDPAWQHLIAVGLAEHGIEVLCVPAEPAAWAALADCGVQVVLWDLASGPNSQGIGAAAVARWCAERSLPWVALSLRADDAVIREAFAAGARDFFVKSLHWQWLAERTLQVAAAAGLRSTLAQRQRRVARAEALALNARQVATRAHTLLAHDALTGWLHRAGFIEAAQAQLGHVAPEPNHEAALLLINLDRFQRLNQSLGARAADAALQEVAQRLEKAFRNVPVVVCGRVASDEFAMLFSGLRRAQAAEGAAQIVLNALERPMLCDGVECVVRASVGIAMADVGLTPERLLAQAAQAVAAVKRAGGHAFRRYVPPAAALRAAPRYDLETALHQSLPRGELVLHYQPIVNPRGGRVAGVEALMRWQHGGRLVSPADFIPIAEASGLIDALGEWAIQEALKQVRRWRDAGVAINAVAVNIHAGHLERPSLIGVVAQALESNQLEPTALELELTETGLMRDVGRAMASLRALKQLGVRLALDDFGTGYSSLAYLTQLPIDTLKIDRSFVTQLADSGQSRAVVRSITALAQALGLSTIAEGVETREQLDSLRALGCQDVQGFFYAQPMPAADLPAWLQRFQRAVLGPSLVGSGPALA